MWNPKFGIGVAVSPKKRNANVLFPTMQFTPQQLSGGVKYSPVARVGNWFEEIALEKAQKEAFLQRSSGRFTFNRQEKKCCTIVPHSFSPDGLVRFGDTVILQHDSSGSILACDPFDDQMPGQEKFLVTTVLESTVPKARNTFRIVRPREHLISDFEDYPDDILRFDQPFNLACNETLLANPSSTILDPTLYLCSAKKSERMSTKATNRQLVFMSKNNDSESVWTAIKPSRGRINASDRFLSSGDPITVNDAFILVHRQTNMYVTCDPNYKHLSEYGTTEYECYADRCAAPGKLGILVSEFNGTNTKNTLAKPDPPSFRWYFIYSSDESSSIDQRILPPPATVGVIIQEVRQLICAKGFPSFWELRSYFSTVSSRVNVDGKIDREDMKDLLLSYGLSSMNSQHVDVLLDLIDKKKIGLVDWRDFLTLIRGPIPSERIQRIQAIYLQLLSAISPITSSSTPGTRRTPMGTTTTINNNNNNQNLSVHPAIPLVMLLRQFIGGEHPLLSISNYNMEEMVDHLKSYFLTFSIASSMNSGLNLNRVETMNMKATKLASRTTAFVSTTNSSSSSSIPSSSFVPMTTTTASSYSRPVTTTTSNPLLPSPSSQQLLENTSVSLESFMEYYFDLSAMIEDDSYFYSVLNSNWAIR